jgi:hypothetical protein
MKSKIKACFFVVLVLSFTNIMIGCASAPKLDTPTQLQQVLNRLPEIPVAGKNVKFEFGGDVWISKVNGKEFLAGTFKSEENAGGSILTLTQTHIYSDQQKPGIGGDVGWVKTPGPEIVLEYKKGPPETLTVK